MEDFLVITIVVLALVGGLLGIFACMFSSTLTR